jgi:hypothetical protein
MTNYEAAREKYAALGVDTDKAIETLKKVPVSLHCWQLDDVIGFDNDGGLTGGIQTTGNYMGRARTPEQLMADMEEAMRLMPGTAKLNIHASYAIFAPGEFADRDALEPKHFAKWVEFSRCDHLRTEITDRSRFRRSCIDCLLREKCGQFVQIIRIGTATNDLNTVVCFSGQFLNLLCCIGIAFCETVVDHTGNFRNALWHLLSTLFTGFLHLARHMLRRKKSRIVGINERRNRLL